MPFSESFVASIISLVPTFPHLSFYRVTPICVFAKEKKVSCVLSDSQDANPTSFLVFGATAHVCVQCEVSRHLSSPQPPTQKT